MKEMMEGTEISLNRVPDVNARIFKGTLPDII